MAKKKLTKKQKALYDIIVKYNAVIGVSPTIRELAYELDKNPSTIYSGITHLIRKGYIKKINKKKRGLIIIR